MMERAPVPPRSSIALMHRSPFRPCQVVHDFNNSAIALRLHFGAGFAIHQVLDLQLVFEAVHGRIGADAASVMRAFGQDTSYSDAASRCHLLPSLFLASCRHVGTTAAATSIFFYCLVAITVVVVVVVAATSIAAAAAFWRGVPVGMLHRSLQMVHPLDSAIKRHRRIRTRTMQ